MKNISLIIVSLAMFIVGYLTKTFMMRPELITLTTQPVTEQPLAVPTEPAASPPAVVEVEVSRPQGKWVESHGIHFSFSYPQGWHVFSNGTEFYLDNEPLFAFPHQKVKFVQADTTDEKTAAIKRLTEEQGYAKYTAIKSALNPECYEDQTYTPPEGTFDVAYGEVVCFVDIPWGTNETITYVFTGSDTKAPTNLATFKTFIESIKAN